MNPETTSSPECREGRSVHPVSATCSAICFRDKIHRISITPISRSSGISILHSIVLAGIPHVMNHDLHVRGNSTHLISEVAANQCLQRHGCEDPDPGHDPCVIRELSQRVETKLLKTDQTTINRKDTQPTEKQARSLQALDCGHPRCLDNRYVERYPRSVKQARLGPRLNVQAPHARHLNSPARPRYRTGAGPGGEKGSALSDLHQTIAA